MRLSHSLRRSPERASTDQVQCIVQAPVSIAAFHSANSAIPRPVSWFRRCIKCGIILNRIIAWLNQLTVTSELSHVEGWLTTAPLQAAPKLSALGLRPRVPTVCLLLVFEIEGPSGQGSRGPNLCCTLFGSSPRSPDAWSSCLATQRYRGVRESNGNSSRKANKENGLSSVEHNNFSWLRKQSYQRMYKYVARVVGSGNWFR